MSIDGASLSTSNNIIDIVRNGSDKTVTPPIKLRSEKLDDHYNEARINFEGRYSLILRAYDNGVAYRFETQHDGQITVNHEIADFQLASDALLHFPEEESLISHNERLYKTLKTSAVDEDDLASLPLLASLDGHRLLFTETDLQDYPGMWIRGQDGNTLAALFPKAVKASHMENDRNSAVDARHDYLAVTKGARPYPWRIIMIARDDTELLNNNMPYLLAEPSRIDDTSWIKPGQIAWDWYNANNLYGVDFKAGLNTETYKYFIDFAAENGIEYVIFDEGWYKLGDVLNLNPEMDTKGLIEYANSKNVGIILWVVWKTLDDKLDEALDTFEEWGVKGIKVDFMQRDDQWMVNYYWRISEAAAKRKMIVDYHGAHKPAGLWRTFPNTLSYEGVLGLEHSKWSDDASPNHNVTLPFIRMAVGPTDYTPGGLSNAHPENRGQFFERPITIGTRAHQVAMYMIFESALQMLADSPSQYNREKPTLEFVRDIPTVWDETIPLMGRVGKYVAVARRNGNEWFVGAMTNDTGRTLDIDLSFLGSGPYDATIFADGINADRFANDHKVTRLNVRADQKLSATLEKNGGWAARFTPADQ
jgi:alpha-glucosidase